MIALGQHVAIFIPSTKDVDKQLPTTEYRKEINQAIVFLSKEFGGATAIPATGGWLSGNALVTEDVTIVVSFTEKLSQREIQTVIAYANELKNRLSQEVISVLVNGKLFFVE